MYKALYRKYRPEKFDDVVGQEFVIKTLKNSIMNDKISHAYMFFGPRGIGKTTIAKILARTVNCEKPVDGNLCGECEKCKKSKNSVDIIEIDAASNNGVDEIREIRNKVNIVPSELKYKVYIIDEVHMLTSGAFNALLKTLEEPPKHVIFILATTDPQKVSETIISRCQCYSFKRISVEKIVERLMKVSQEEKINIENEVLQLIAKYSEGGLRDSLGLLDKLSSYKNDKINTSDFYEMNDMIESQELIEFQNDILNRNVAEVIKKISSYNDNGKNIIEIVNQLIDNLRNDIIEIYVNNLKKEPDNMVKLVNILNEKMFDIKKSSNPKIYVEILLLNYMNKNENISREIILDVGENKKNQCTISNVEENKKSQDIKTPDIEKNKNFKPKTNIKEILDIRINNILASASKKEKREDQKLIDNLNKYVFDQEYGHVVSEILSGTLQVSSHDGILFSFEYESSVSQNIENINKITEVYNKLTNSNKKIAIVSLKKWEKIKKEYIKNIKNGKKYDIIEEPEIINLDKEIRTEENPIDMFKEIIEIK